MFSRKCLSLNLILSLLPNKESRPTWARGLKLAEVVAIATYSPSRPTWARGLKHSLGTIYVIRKRVAPHVGAWIETNGHTRE